MPEKAAFTFFLPLTKLIFFKNSFVILHCLHKYNETSSYLYFNWNLQTKGQDKELGASIPQILF